MRKKIKSHIFVFFVLSLMFLSACGPAEIVFSIKHLNEQPGEQTIEILSYEVYPGLDNSAGQTQLRTEVQLSRNYRHQIIQHLTTQELSGQSVQNKIVETYKLPPNDPTGQERKALCPLSVVIPAGKKAKLTIQWTERWAYGVINEGKDGNGKRLGTYDVLLGYSEPCSLINQENN